MTPVLLVLDYTYTICTKPVDRELPKLNAQSDLSSFCHAGCLCFSSGLGHLRRNRTLCRWTFMSCYPSAPTYPPTPPPTWRSPKHFVVEQRCSLTTETERPVHGEECLALPALWTCCCLKALWMVRSRQGVWRVPGPQRDSSSHSISDLSDCQLCLSGARQGISKKSHKGHVNYSLLSKVTLKLVLMNN